MDSDAYVPFGAHALAVMRAAAAECAYDASMKLDASQDELAPVTDWIDLTADWMRDQAPLRGTDQPTDEMHMQHAAPGSHPCTSTPPPKCPHLYASTRWPPRVRALRPSARLHPPAPPPTHATARAPTSPAAGAKMVPQ